MFEKDHEDQFNDYRDEDVEEKRKCFFKKLSQLPIHQLRKQIKVDELLWDFDGNSLYPSAMWDEKITFTRIEKMNAFTPDMN